jgi:hypothetical protein
MAPAARDRLDALKSGMRRTKHLLEQLLVLARAISQLPRKCFSTSLQREWLRI